MFWEILWALILGFALSGAVQAVVSKSEMRRLLPDDSPRSLGIACGLGAASSSCSSAAVALARSLFRRGADFTAAMAFEFGSANLVIELGILMALVLGWQFTLGEFVGGPLMIVLLALVFRLFLRRGLVEEAREQAERGVLGRMEGHAEMDMSVQRTGSLWRRLRSPEGFTATANYFVMDWARSGSTSPAACSSRARSRPECRSTSGARSSSTATPRWRSSGGPSSGRPAHSAASSARSATCRWRRSSGTAASASAGPRLRLRRPHRAPDPRRLPQEPLRTRERRGSARSCSSSARSPRRLSRSVRWRFVRTGGLSMLRMMNAPMKGHGHSHEHAR